MKRIYDFVVCPGRFGPQTIWYRVSVGASDRERAALARLRRFASSSPAVFLALHDAQVESVRCSLARASFPAMPRPEALMRVKHVGVLSMVRCLRSVPLALLNSERISTPVTLPAMLLAGWCSEADVLIARRRRSSRFVKISKKSSALWPTY